MLLDTTSWRVRGIPKKVLFRGTEYNSLSHLIYNYGFTRPFLKATMKSFHVDMVEATDILSTFFSQYKGNRPKLLKRLPYVIYNNQWIESVEDFCKLCGVEVRVLRSAMVSLDTRDPFQAMVFISKRTKISYRDKYDGSILTTPEVEDKYNNKTRNAVKYGYVEKVEVKRHPSCTYNQTGYCATVYHDYLNFKNQYLATSIQPV